MLQVAYQIIIQVQLEILMDLLIQETVQVE